MAEQVWSEKDLARRARRRLARLQHADEVSGNVAATCRYYGISRTVFCRWKRRYEEEGLDGLKDRSSAPLHCPNLRDRREDRPLATALPLRSIEDRDVPATTTCRSGTRRPQRLTRNRRRIGRALGELGRVKEFRTALETDTQQATSGVAESQAAEPVGA